jgi:hypothetical protein
MVFSGRRVCVIGKTAETLTRTLNLPSAGPVRNPATAAYVRNVPDPGTVDYVVG